MVTKSLKKWVSKLKGGRKNAALVPSEPDYYRQEDLGIDLRSVHSAAIEVCKTLQAKGFEAYIVGGAVRDLILGLKPKDFDVATNARPEQVKRCFKRAYIIGKRFKLVHVMLHQQTIETSTFRAPVSDVQTRDEHGRVVSDNVFGTLQEDAGRRDLSINALYYDPVRGEVLDFFKGVPDLQARVVRMIGHAKDRYREDPVRIVRVLRFAAKLKGKIDPEAERYIADKAPLLDNVPASRRIDECMKVLMSGRGEAGLDLLVRWGLLPYLFPLLNHSLKANAAWIKLCLQRMDARIAQHKPVSESYVYASMLWPLLSQAWEEQMALGQSPFNALDMAIDAVISAQVQFAGLQRRFSVDMRVIWNYQLRLHRAKADQVARFAEHPRFRASVDFLVMRAMAGEVPHRMASWWMQYADADSETRDHLLESFHEYRDSRFDPAKKSRRRRRRSAKRGTPSQ